MLPNKILTKTPHMEDKTKCRVIIDRINSGKIIEIELTRDLCEGIYAITEVVGKVLGEKNEGIKSAALEILNQVPKEYTGIVKVPFTGEAAVSILSLCLLAKEMKPTGELLEWLLPLTDAITSSIHKERIQCKILIDNVEAFVNP